MHGERWGASDSKFIGNKDLKIKGKDVLGKMSGEGIRGHRL